MIVTIYEICNASVDGGDQPLPALQAVDRAWPATDDVLLTTLEALLAGPTTAEVEAGFISWFSSDTAGALLEAPTISDGTAVINLDATAIEGLENVSTSTGGEYFRGQIYATLFQFDSVSGVSVFLDGDDTAFCLLLQLSTDCNPIERSEWTNQTGSTR